LAELKSLWQSMQLPAEELESHLTEFQVAEADGKMIGALGLQILYPHALLHSEAYSDYSLADAARQVFWERIQSLAAHHRVFRIWTVETSPFWTRWGFQVANPELLQRQPDAWRLLPGHWLTFELKNEDAITAALEDKVAGLRQEEQKQSARVAAKAKTLKTIIIVVGFTIGILGICVALFMLIHRNPFR
jgi:N-acetylglutamate synthase-like GNAT family acetyltransferase